MFKHELEELGACIDAQEWVGEKSKEQAYKECTESSWISWYLKRNKIPMNQIRVMDLAIDICSMEQNQDRIQDVLSCEPIASSLFYNDKLWVQAYMIEMLDAWRENLPGVFFDRLHKIMMEISYPAENLRRYLP